MFPAPIDENENPAHVVDYENLSRIAENENHAPQVENENPGPEQPIFETILEIQNKNPKSHMLL